MQEEAQRKQEAVGWVGGGRGQRGHGVDTVSLPSEAGCPAPSALPLLAHHAQVVHEAGPMGPNVGRCTGQRLHADLLAAVQLPDSAYHHVHGIKHQGSRQLGRGQRWGGAGKRQLSWGTPKALWCYPEPLGDSLFRNVKPCGSRVRTSFWVSFLRNV